MAEAVAGRTREGCTVGNLSIRSDVLAQATATFEVLAREAALVVEAPLNGTGSSVVVNAAANAEQWYRGAAAELMHRLEQAGNQAGSVGENFSGVDAALGRLAAS